MKPVNSFDKTNFLQSLMHMIKGNFGTGILAMPASFNHCGLINALIGLPVLCLIATYCVHLLVRSSQHLENKMKCNSSSSLEYAELAKGAFVTGPKWMRPFSGSMCLLVDLVQILCQLGICCVYLVFIVDNFKMVRIMRVVDSFTKTQSSQFSPSIECNLETDTIQLQHKPTKLS